MFRTPELLLSFSLIGASLSAGVASKPSLFQHQPLRFEENRGQSPARARYIARGPNYQLSIERDRNELTWVNPQTKAAATVRTRFAGANPRAAVEGMDLLVPRTNYFFGAHAADWRTGIANYAKVRIAEIYRGVDLVFHGNSGQLEYDFVVAPGADPSSIQFRIDGANRMAIDATGALVLSTQAGEIRWNTPSIYQGDGTRVEGRFELASRGRVRFRVAAYDRKRVLVIDPTLSYATYFGGSGNDWARAIAADNSGNIYIAGISSSPSLHVTAGTVQTSYGGEAIDNITGDGFVAKFNSSGALLWSTFLGGNADDAVFGLAVDGAGNAYVTGFTNSPDFPVTQGVLQGKFGGFGGNYCNRFGDAFVAKINPSGTQLIYSTFLGGTLDDAGAAIAIDSSGNAYVAGATLSKDFPVTSGVVQPAFAGFGLQQGRPNCDNTPAFNTGDAFVAKVNPAATKLIWSTYLGGSADDAALAIAIDGSQNVYVAGATLSSNFPTQNPLQSRFGGADPQNEFFNSGDGFVTKLNSSASALVYSTYLGGSGDDAVYGIFVDTAGTAYLTGPTSSQNFPVTQKAVQPKFGGYFTLPDLIEQNQGDAFVTRLSASGNSVMYSTYLGGLQNDIGTGIAVDSAGIIYVAGATDSYDFPVTSDAYKKAMSGDGGVGNYVPVGDGFLTVIDPNSSTLVYGTYFGGTLDDWFSGLAFDSAGNLWTVGGTLSTNFPVTSNAAQKTYGGDRPSLGQRGDTILAKFTNQASTTAPTVAAIQNAAGYATNVVSPGMIFVLYGTNMGPATLTGGSLDANGNLATTQSGTTVFFDGRPAPIVYTSAGLVSGIAPYGIDKQATTQITLQYNGQTSLRALAVPVQAAVPGIFSADFTGAGLAFAFNQDFTRNSPSNPAAAGSEIVMFGTGEGQTAPPGQDGRITNAGTLAKPVLACTATVGGQAAGVDYCGSVPSVVEGEIQLNLHLSSNIGSGPQPVVVNLGPYASQANLVVYIK